MQSTVFNPETEKAWRYFWAERYYRNIRAVNVRSVIQENNKGSVEIFRRLAGKMFPVFSKQAPPISKGCIFQFQFLAETFRLRNHLMQNSASFRRSCENCPVNLPGKSTCHHCRTERPKNCFCLEDAHSKWSQSTLDKFFQKTRMSGKPFYKLKNSAKIREVTLDKLEPIVWIPPTAMKTPALLRRQFLGDPMARMKGILTAIASGDEEICKDFCIREMERHFLEERGTWLETLQLLTTMECLQCREPTLNVCPYYQCLLCWNCHKRTCCRTIKAEEVHDFGLIKEKFDLLPYTRQYCRKQVAAFAATSYGVPEHDVLSFVAKIRNEGHCTSRSPGQLKPGAQGQLAKRRVPLSLLPRVN